MNEQRNDDAIGLSMLMTASLHDEISKKAKQCQISKSLLVREILRTALQHDDNNKDAI
jgi:hypothetical protein